MNPKIIAIGGVSTCGKDTFFKTLAKLKPGAIRISIGDIIRRDCRNLILYTMGIDVNNCTAVEKELVRPILVGYGISLRNQTKGKYFRDALDAVVNDSRFNTTTYFVLTDLRFAEYEYDEPQWVKDHGGVIVHISRYTIGNVTGVGQKVLYKQPINDSEAENDPKLKSLADYKVVWQSINEQANFNMHVNGFLDWLKAS